ncbi:hypothetical protein [Clostridium cuniculi]|uniref:hypothetical protein n=1 Tax=Clostridium cuniculi TaxID=2548455 RepID=UPI001054F2B9|nr:hypothetical protein [Clostridium cuniculi]
MLNYIKADLNRIINKKSFLYVTLGYLLLFLIMMFIIYTPNFNGIEYISKTEAFLEFYPIVIGIPIFLSVYYDDFKSKSMQIAIGYGIPRYKVVLSKVIESILLSIVIGFIFGILILSIPIVLKIQFTGAEIIEAILDIVISTLKIVGYLSISSILVYTAQNAVIGIVGYLLLTSNIIFIILTLILGQSFIINTFGDLSKYLYTLILYSVKNIFIQNGSFNLINFMGIAIYIIIPVMISIILFKKKELEF